MSARDVLIVMTRLPREGRNKSRLIPALGPAGATAMHDRLARHAVGMASSYVMMHPGVLLEIHLDGGTPHEGRKWLGDFVCIAQTPGDLGQRMRAAADRAFTHGAERVVIIGTDCPSLDEAGLAQAFDALETSDVVFGPAADGGYYLIGLAKIYPSLFSHVEWGSCRVLDQSLDAAREALLDVTLLEVRKDVDLPSDLPAARAVLDLSPRGIFPHESTMKPSLNLNLLLPSLCADALALGTHWIYNPSAIGRLYPAGTSNYDVPRSKYHPGKSAGDFTHYGDQTLVLLRSIIARGGFSLDGWREDWLAFWKSNPPAYLDGATKVTLGFLEQGADAASDSNDLAGASRIAPILACLTDHSLEERINSARAQTALTHGDRATVDCAEFFTRAVDAVLCGQSIPEALDTASSSSYNDLDSCGFLNRARSSLELQDRSAGEFFGLTCHTPEAFPFTLWFLLRYHDQPLEAIIHNTMAGGDNAARGMIIGLLMGAAYGHDWLPGRWLVELNARDEIDKLSA